MPGKKRKMAKEPHRRHRIRPEDVVVFVELDGFTDDWRGMKLLDDDLHALQLAIMAKPKGAPVIEGTSRLRKIRYAPLRSGKGKSGGNRVCYVYFEEYSVVLLVLAYPKNEKDDLSDAEKKAIKKLIENIEDEFAKGYRR
jgi:hypothetical protein